MYKKGGDKHCPESMKLREKMEKKYIEKTINTPNQDMVWQRERPQNMLI
jgi:hypothetical protein